MSTELHDALSQAGEAGRARFESRDAVEVISPAARRVARHRTAVKLGTGLASFVAIAGLLWGVDGLGGRNTGTVDPAVPTGVDGSAVDAETLLSSAAPRTKSGSETASGHGTPALKCDAGDTNPHVEDGAAAAGVQCEAIWVDSAVAFTIGGDSVISVDQDARTITYSWQLVNSGDAAVLVDVAGIIPVLVAAGDGAVSGPAIVSRTHNSTLAVADEWDSESVKASLLTSDEDIRVVEPGEIITGEALWEATPGANEADDAVQRVLNQETFASFDLHVRVAPSGEPGSTELLLDVNDGTSFQPGVPGTSTWDVADLAAIAEPRAEFEERNDAVPGMICHHEQPDHDPRVSAALESTGADVVPENRVVFEDCDPVWFVDGPRTSLRDFITGTQGDSLASLGATLRNDGSRALQFDEESVFAWVETDAAEAQPHVFSSVGVAKSMFDKAGKVIMQLDGRATPVTLEAQDFYDINLTEQGDVAALAAPLRDHGYTVTYWARVHEDNPDGSATYLIELGAPDVN